MCVVEIQSESAWALTNITSGNTCHAKSMHLRQVVLKKNISIFFCVFFWFKPRASIFSTGGHFVHGSGTALAILVEGHLSNIPMKFE